DELLCFAAGVDGGDAIAARLERSTEGTRGVGVVLDEENVRGQSPTLPRSAGDFYPPQRFCWAHCYATGVFGSRSSLNVPLREGREVRLARVRRYFWRAQTPHSGGHSSPVER